MADAAEGTAFAGGCDRSAASALGHQGPGEHTGRFACARRGSDAFEQWSGLLEHRGRLAGQQRFVHREVGRLDEAHVGRHPVAFGQQHDVAADDFAASDALRFTVSDHQGAWAREVAQGFQRPFGAALLDEGYAHHDDDETHQHQRFVPIAERHVDRAAGHQQQEHGLRDDFTQEAQHSARPGDGQLVGPVLDQTPARVSVAQPIVRGVIGCHGYEFSGRGRRNQLSMIQIRSTPGIHVGHHIQHAVALHHTLPGDHGNVVA